MAMLFVASFIGIKNYYSARLVKENMVTFARINEQIAVRITTETSFTEGFILIRGEDILLSEGPVETSATNNFEGVIAEIIPTRGGLDVVVDIGVELHALITRESLIHLGLAVNKHCWVHFKATAVKFIGK
jgi:molybdopterin-binding protein